MAGAGKPKSGCWVPRGQNAVCEARTLSFAVPGALHPVPEVTDLPVANVNRSHLAAVVVEVVLQVREERLLMRAGTLSAGRKERTAHAAGELSLLSSVIANEEAERTTGVRTSGTGPRGPRKVREAWRTNARARRLLCRPSITGCENDFD